MVNSMPPMNLSPEATPWGREMMNRVMALEAKLAANQQDTDNVLRTVNGALTNLGESVQYLRALSGFAYSEFSSTATGFTGWYTGTRPSVIISSETGRLEIGYGGALNGGDGYFCFSAVGTVSGTIVTRDSVLSNPARRVAVSGGASFAPSGWHTGVIDVPRGEQITLTLEINSLLSFVTIFGGSIYARPTP